MTIFIQPTNIESSPGSEHSPSGEVRHMALHRVHELENSLNTLRPNVMIITNAAPDVAHTALQDVVQKYFPAPKSPEQIRTHFAAESAKSEQANAETYQDLLKQMADEKAAEQAAAQTAAFKPDAIVAETTAPVAKTEPYVPSVPQNAAELYERNLVEIAEGSQHVGSADVAPAEDRAAQARRMIADSAVPGDDLVMKIPEDIGANV
jgi:chemotaxis protein histidine kinase CheA